MDRKQIESVINTLEDYRTYLWSDEKSVPMAITIAIFNLKAAIRESDADPCDECECEGCKTTEPAPHEAAEDYSPGFWRYLDTASDELFVRVGDNGNTSISTADDYEIRLKAWESVLEFNFGGDCEFSAMLSAATKLYNFLSGQNEDTK